MTYGNKSFILFVNLHFATGNELNTEIQLHVFRVTVHEWNGDEKNSYNFIKYTFGAWGIISQDKFFARVSPIWCCSRNNFPWGEEKMKRQTVRRKTVTKTTLKTLEVYRHVVMILFYKLALVFYALWVILFQNERQYRVLCLKNLSTRKCWFFVTIWCHLMCLWEDFPHAYFRESNTHTLWTW